MQCSKQTCAAGCAAGPAALVQPVGDLVLLVHLADAGHLEEHGHARQPDVVAVKVDGRAAVDALDVGVIAAPRIDSC